MSLTIYRLDTSTVVSAGSTITIPIGSTLTLSATATSDEQIRWFSSTANNTVFTIGSGTTVYSNTVTITPVAAGTAQNGLYCWEGNVGNVKIEIEVIGGSTTASVTLTDSDKTVIPNNGIYEMTAGESRIIYASVSGTSDDSAGVSWSLNSSETKYSLGTTTSTLAIVSVGTTVGTGTQPIVATSNASSSVKSSFYIRVVESTVTYVDSISVTYDDTTVTDETVYVEMNTGSSLNLSAVATLNTGAADSTGVSWELSSSEGLVSLSSSTTSSVVINVGNTAGETTYPIICRSNTTTSKYIEIYVTVISGISVVNVILTDENNVRINNNDTIEIVAGGSLAINGFVLLSNSTIDTEYGIRWSLNSSETKYSITSQSTTAATITAGSTAGTGTYYIYAYSARDSSKYVRFLVTVTETPVGVDRLILVWSGGSSQADSAYIDIYPVSSIELTGYAVLDDGTIDDAGVWWNTENVDQLEYVVTNKTSSSALVTSKSTPGEAISTFYMYSQRDETVQMEIHINILEAEADVTVWIHNGGAWEEYEPFIYDGTAWTLYVADIYPFASST